MSKKPLNIHADIAKRKFGIPKKLPYTFYYLVGRTPFLGGKYHPTYKVIDQLPKDGPAFVIFNHLSRRDHTFVTSICWPRRINIVCQYNEFCRSHLHGVFGCVDILPKKVFCSDINGMRAMDSIIRQGGIVAFSPEGTSSIYGNNQPIAPGTARYLQAYRVPVYFVEIRGSYLTNNKISAFSDRIGKVDVALKLLFSAEQIKSMSVDEIDRKINEAFHHDDYLWNKEHHVEFKCKGSMTERLGDICFRCPKCGSMFTMEEGKDEIHCTKCGNKATMDHFYNLQPADKDSVVPETPSKWSQWERSLIAKEVRNPNFKLEIPCGLGYLPNDKWVPKDRTSVPCGEGKAIVDHEGFHYVGTKLGKEIRFDLNYKQIWTFAIAVDMTILSLYINEEYYEFTGLNNKGPYLMICVEEMHRYHVNTWKNLPEFDWMYAGLELGIDNKK